MGLFPGPPERERAGGREGAAVVVCRGRAPRLALRMGLFAIPTVRSEAGDGGGEARGQLVRPDG